jgi:hypothetical protein
MCSFGFGYLLKKGGWKLRVFAAVISVLLFLFLLFARFPIQNQEIKECIAYIQENMDDSNKIYLHPTVMLVFKYYNETGKVNEKISVVNKNKVEYWERNFVFFMNRSFVVSKDDFADDWLTLDGKNWILASFPTENYAEDFFNYIDSLGYKRIKEHRTFRGSAYLYDFGEKEE